MLKLSIRRDREPLLLGMRNGVGVVEIFLLMATLSKNTRSAHKMSLICKYMCMIKVKFSK